MTQRNEQSFAMDNDLIARTSEFMALHWPSNAGTATPDWSPTIFARSSGPWANHDTAGCYALFDSAGLIYIGSAISRSSGQYEKDSIGRRLQKYFRVTKDENGVPIHAPKPEWETVETLRTIGFPRDYYYLAPALEQYLIGHLVPRENALGRNARD